MKKHALKYSGLVLIIIGIFSIIVQPFNSMTGAVIDLSTFIFKTYFLMGLAITAMGAIFLFLGTRE